MIMNKYNTENINEWAHTLTSGSEILLSGVVYTARDAAHKRIAALIDGGKELPFRLQGAVIYYVGPTPERPGMPIGSCGPTTSSRMDFYTPRFLDEGLKAVIGKGNRNEATKKALMRNKAVYLCALGGGGALAARCVKSLEVIAFEELGCESVKRLEFEDFPLFVGIDSKGNTIFGRE